MIPGIVSSFRRGGVPPAIYRGFDPANKGANAVLQNGDFDLTTIPTANMRWALSKDNKSSGKWRVQFVHVNQVNTMGGGFALNNSIGNFLGSNANGAGLFANYGIAVRVYRNNTFASFGGAISSGGVVDLYLDLDAGSAWWARNGTVVSGDPATGSGAMQTWAPGSNVWVAGDANGTGGVLRVRTDPAQMVGVGIAGFADGWAA